MIGFTCKLLNINIQLEKQTRFYGEVSHTQKLREKDG